MIEWTFNYRLSECQKWTQKQLWDRLQYSQGIPEMKRRNSTTLPDITYSYTIYYIVLYIVHTVAIDIDFECQQNCDVDEPEWLTLLLCDIDGVHFTAPNHFNPFWAVTRSNLTFHTFKWFNESIYSVECWIKSLQTCTTFLFRRVGLFGGRSQKIQIRTCSRRNGAYEKD